MTRNFSMIWNSVVIGAGIWSQKIGSESSMTHVGLPEIGARKTASIYSAGFWSVCQEHKTTFVEDRAEVIRAELVVLSEELWIFSKSLFKSNQERFSAQR